MWETLTEAGLQRPIAVNFALVRFIRSEPDGSHIVFTSGEPLVVMENMETILSRIAGSTDASRTGPTTSLAAPRGIS